jgi:hypothetical protein
MIVMAGLVADPMPGVLAAVRHGSGGLLAFSTAGDVAAGLPFGWDIATVQRGVLIYLGVSSLAFVLVWVIGYLRRA